MKSVLLILRVSLEELDRLREALRLAAGLSIGGLKIDLLAEGATPSVLAALWHEEAANDEFQALRDAGICILFKESFVDDLNPLKACEELFQPMPASALQKIIDEASVRIVFEDRVPSREKR